MDRTEIHISHSQGTRIMVVNHGLAWVADAFKPEELARGWPWFNVGGRNVVVNPNHVIYIQEYTGNL